ncbi:dehydrogenase reductase SDR family member 12-like protein [Labeo rohita]|uniref:Dehydrogenase reductase SDR family member 12-like protein n=1 Tax=Labeo rohita TaxID=84645 RepID=A0A498MRD2_LABRO|nr:dehydrogenase reductase SDR family member 12-like protein [Labeo rohita]
MCLYRNIVWFIKGMREYTRAGFENASKRFVAKDLDVSMVGRSFMITGANSGIGKATAMAIAKKAVAKAMPQFYQMMRDRLRTPEQGADTLVWLAVSRATTAFPSGLFFQDRKPVSAHLPLAWTHSSRREVKVFMRRLETLAMTVKPSE